MYSTERMFDIMEFELFLGRPVRLTDTDRLPRRKHYLTNNDEGETICYLRFNFDTYEFEVVDK